MRLRCDGKLNRWVEKKKTKSKTIFHKCFFFHSRCSPKKLKGDDDDVADEEGEINSK